MNATYDPALLLASCCVATCVAFALLSLGARIAALDSERAGFWLFGGALTLGTGLWATHIVGLSTLRLPIAVSYDLGLTALSWCVAFGVSVLALYLISRDRLGPLELLGGALPMGAGLCLMQFSGLWAMRLKPGVTYDPQLLAASAALAVLASAALLFICFSARRLAGARAMPARIAAALAIGAVLCATHYTGLSAARFTQGALCAAGNLVGGSWMGLPLALISIERSRAERQRAEVERVRRMAYYDAVTGLPNRSLFNETLLRQMIGVNGKPPPPFGVVYIELRGYRALVETLGQDRINLIVKSLAGQVSQNLHEGDLLARLSHDGFVCLLRQHEARSIETGMAQISARFKLPLQHESQSYRLAWGIGMSRYPENGTSTQALVRAAMKLQYELGGEAQAARQETVSALGAA